MYSLSLDNKRLSGLSIFNDESFWTYNISYLLLIEKCTLRTRGQWATSLTREIVPINLICTKQWLWHNLKSKTIIFSYLVIYGLIIYKKKHTKNPPKNLSSFHTKIHNAKFGSICTSGPGEDNYWILLMYLRYFIVITNWKVAVYLNTLTQGCFVPSLLEIGTLVLKRRFF